MNNHDQGVFPNSKHYRNPKNTDLHLGSIHIAAWHNINCDKKCKKTWVSQSVLAPRR